MKALLNKMKIDLNREQLLVNNQFKKQDNKKMSQISLQNLDKNPEEVMEITGGNSAQ